MVSATDLKELALVPVRGTAYVVKLPFVTVWMVLVHVCAFLYRIVTKIISIPVSYVNGAASRIQLTWNWTKSKVLPWKSANNATPPMIEMEDYQVYGSPLSQGLRQRHHRGRRSRQKAIISSLIKILMEPGSPLESEEETELSGDEDDKVYKLIRDLVQFSKSGQHSLVLEGSREQTLDMETLKRHARDKQKLQHLISELDQYVKEMDSGSKRHEIGDDYSSGMQDNARGDMLHEEYEHLLTPDPTASSNPDTDMYMDASDGESDLAVSGDESAYEEEEEEAEFDDAPSHLNPQHLTCRGLSPVVEMSPEVTHHDSTEALDRNCVDLEEELNTALTRLTTLTGELAEVKVLESRQTKITETVTIASCPTDTEEMRKTSTDSSFEDACDDFPSIPKTSPTLGLDVGHSRRNLATARKARPPSSARQNKQPPADGVRDKDGVRCSLTGENSQEFENSSDSECDEIEVPRAAPHSLSDQFKLLTPSSSPRQGAVTQGQHQTQDQQSQAISDLYSTVHKPSRTRSEGEPGRDTPPELERCRSQSDSQAGGNSTGKSLFIHDTTPPWKQIRARNSVTADSPNATPARTPDHRTPDHHSSRTQQPTPPQLPPRRSITPPTQPQPPQRSITHPTQPQPPHRGENNGYSPGHQVEVYDKLPRVLPAPPIPSKAGQEGMYDIIPGHTRRMYLHEKMTNNDRSTPPVTWTPQLPPRNSARTLKRTCSAETMGTIEKDHDKLSRHSSERRASVSSAREERKRPDSASASKRSHSSTSMDGDQERRVKRERSSSDQRHRHHHHHHSRSSERSSEKHRSSSEKHRSSSSSDKKPKSSESSGSSVWKLLTNPSKTKASSSKSKESSSKKKEREGKREKDGERKHSSRGKEGTPESPDHFMAPLSLSQRNKEAFPIHRNGSFSSLRSGISMHSTDSSGQESLV